MNEMLERRISKRPPQSQREACALAVRQSLATIGPMPPHLIPAAAEGLTKGLFGEAFDTATEQQQQRWIGLMEFEYRETLKTSNRT